MNLIDFGLPLTLVGAVLVFAGLAMILGGRMMMKSAGQGKQKEIAAPAPQEEEILPAAQAQDAGEHDRLIAVITAAVAAMMADSQDGFVVRRVRRVSQDAAFGRIGREEQMYSRM